MSKNNSAPHEAALEAFKAACDELGMTTKDLAAKVGCDRKAMARYRKGLVPVKLPVFEKVMQLYNQAKKKKV